MKNTALVICFDEQDENGALRDPFKKKPQLRSQKQQKIIKEKTPGLILATPARQPSDKTKNLTELVEPQIDKQPLTKEEMRMDFFFDEASTKTPVSIAELFLAKKKLDQDSAAMSQQQQTKEGAPKKMKSKEELAELRKQMMKKRKTACSA